MQKRKKGVVLMNARQRDYVLTLVKVRELELRNEYFKIERFEKKGHKNPIRKNAILCELKSIEKILEKI